MDSKTTLTVIVVTLVIILAIMTALICEVADLNDKLQSIKDDYDYYFESLSGRVDAIEEKQNKKIFKRKKKEIKNEK